MRRSSKTLLLMREFKGIQNKKILIVEKVK